MSTKNVLSVQHMTKTYTNQTVQNTIFEDFSLDVKEKEFLCILGASGCGKTTLLRCIAGFENYEGNIYIDDEIKSVPGTDRIMVFQDFNQLFPWKTVEKNIQYPLKLQGIKDKNVLKQMSQEALEKVKLADYGNYYPFQLSGGMKQRVAIAKALALKPKIVLMDEPFAALDAMTRRDLQNELIKLAEESNCTFIFITHNIQEAIILGSRIMVLAKNGKIILDQGNTIQRPVSPASEGYTALWTQLKAALYAE